MTHRYPSRTADISLSTGLGSLVVSGIAPSENMRTFSEVLEVGDTIYCGVAHRERDKDEWEEGIYTYIGTDRLARTQIFQSSNAGGIVEFSAGIKDVWALIPSRTAQRADENVITAGVAEVDFGAWPGSPDAYIVMEEQFEIADTSMIIVQVIAVDTDDHSAEEHWVDPPSVTAGEIVAGESFTIRAVAREDNLYGKYAVSWLWK